MKYILITSVVLLSACTYNIFAIEGSYNTTVHEKQAPLVVRNPDYPNIRK